MNPNVYAFLVGIGRYDQPGWSIPAPVANAASIATWLIDYLGVPPENILAFAEAPPDKDEVMAPLRAYAANGLQLVEDARQATIFNAWATKLAIGRPAGSQVLVYWSGHGFADANGRRLFFCRDYTSSNLTTNVFDGALPLRELKDASFAPFDGMLFLADVCAVHMDLAADPPVRQHNPKRTPPFLALYATPEDEYAVGADGQGVFTATVVSKLKEEPAWPNLETLGDRLKLALLAAGQQPFHVEDFRLTQSLPYLAGAVPKSIAGQLHTLLEGLDVSHDRYRLHYLQTVKSLGNPGLYKAQGLLGMLKELASLQDAQGAKELPAGLIEFLLRASKEAEASAPIAQWLDENASAQAATRTTVQARLDLEESAPVLLVELENNQQGRLAGFQLRLLTNDLTRPFGSGVATAPVSLKAPEDFEASFQESLAALLAAENCGAIAEVHFIAAPALYNYRFHSLPAPGGLTLGESMPVLLRTPASMRALNPTVYKSWSQTADSLRPLLAKQLMLCPAALLKAKLLPDSLLYAEFVVPEKSSGPSPEKTAILRLLMQGLPYFFWLHEDCGEGDACFKQLTTSLREWLDAGGSLASLPGRLQQARLAQEPSAQNGTLLWDDPAILPYHFTQGVKMK